jgi:hypothetical protein
MKREGRERDSNLITVGAYFVIDAEQPWATYSERIGRFGPFQWTGGMGLPGHSFVSRFFRAVTALAVLLRKSDRIWLHDGARKRIPDKTNALSGCAHQIASNPTLMARSRLKSILA